MTNLNLKNFPDQYQLMPDPSQIGFLFAVRLSDKKAFKVNINQLSEAIGFEAVNAQPIFFTGNALPSVNNDGQPLKKGDWIILTEGNYTNIGGGASITIDAGKMGVSMFGGVSWGSPKLTDLPAGNTILNGSGSPDAGLGKIGDFYIDNVSTIFYGPKTLSGWGSGTDLTKRLMTEGAASTVIRFENVTGKGYYNLSGILNSASQTYLTDFNACNTNDVVEAQTRTLADSLAIAIFDENKNFIRGVAGAGSTTAALTKRNTTIQEGEFFYRVSSTSTTEAQKFDAYSKLLIGGQESSEEVINASNSIDKNNARSNVVTTEFAVKEFIQSYNIDEINNVLYRFINTDTEETVIDISNNIESGGIAGTGLPINNSQRIRTRDFLNLSGIKIVNSNLCDYVVYFYNSSDQYIGETGWITTEGAKNHFVDNARKLKIIFRNKQSTNITPSDFSSFNVQLFTVFKEVEEIATKREVENGSISQVPFNINTKSKVVTNWKVEKMCHDGNLMIDNNGRFYMPYYASNDSFVETPQAQGVSSRMSYWDVCDDNNIKYLEMMKKGETVGADTFSGSNAPYVPAIFINTSNEDHLLYLANVSINGDPEGYRMAGRYWDKLNEIWVNDTLHKCTLKYSHLGVEKTVQFSEIGIATMVQDLENRTITGVGFQMLMARWKLYNSEYYSFFGAIGNKINGYIIKTTDGINYTVLSQPPTGLINVWEGAIEIVGNELFCVVRGRNNMYIYDLIANTWQDIPNIMTNVVAQRLAMQVKGGYLYLIHNITNVTQSGWSAIRNNVRVMKIDPSSKLVLDKQEFATAHGFHYYGFAEYRGQFYCYFTQDLRNLNPSDPKTNVSFIAWEDLIKI